MGNNFTWKCMALQYFLVISLLTIVKYVWSLNSPFVEANQAKILAFALNIPLVVIITEYNLVEYPTSFHISPT